MEDDPPNGLDDPGRQLEEARSEGLYEGAP